MKAIEQCFPVVLIITLFKVVLNVASVEKILQCDHSNESYHAILSCFSWHCFIMPYKVVLTFESVDKMLY